MSLKSRNWSPVGARRRGLKTFASRLAVRFLAIVAIVGLFHGVDVHVRYRGAMRAKYSETEFAALSDYDQAILASSGWDLESHSSNPGRLVLLENRKHWQKLGKGREGEVFTYNNSVIKVYDDQSSPFRNCVPDVGDGAKRWPTEIPVTLIMGGRRDSSVPPHHDAYKDSYVPVQDYFLAATNPSQPPKWHLVTPFYKSGTLSKLAKKLRHSPERPTYHEVDATFRPSFEALLSALDELHLAHNLCHDDVKLDNIFVASERDPRRWKMGDLGNAREPGHPYHSAPLWTSDTPQLRDCRANDALRLTKSYVEFVRVASGNPTDFDDAFFRGVEPASRFYWTVARNPVPLSAGDVKVLSEAYPPLREGEEGVWTSMEPVAARGSGSATAMVMTVFGSCWHGALGRTVVRELRVGANEWMGKLFGLTGILGVPITSCKAARG
ncbi:hypothetical protein CTRI78_v002833 [Colletotrichum trifolii]|uniref:Protein kinase domain-containing protein n=1 Tax=Colletotrichum trifolii TaxID=5466 RepID=A0A4R8RLC3_COLTR|nr:hypothetical protein CTRI78_v002833 [Colletotrichum trifolii]